MGRNTFIDAAVAHYARMTPAQKARHDIERSMPYRQVFQRKQFPSDAAWARFLTLRCALTERVWGEPIPSRHVEKIGANVLSARESKERAIGGVAGCDACHKEGADVERHRLTSEQNGTLIEKYLCPSCAKWFALDPMLGCSSVEAVPCTT